MVPNGEESYMQISYQNTEDDDEQNFVYKKMKEESSFTFKNLKDDETKEFSLSISKNINGNNCVNNIVAKYEDDYSRIEATIEQEINIVDYFDDEIDLMEEESIDLTQLDEEQLQAVIDIVSNKISEKINELAGIFEKDEDTENDVELNNENEEEFVSET
jgi:hypothetical protein